MKRIIVDLDERGYPIYIGPRARCELETWLATNAPKCQIVIVADRNVADLHGDTLRACLPGDPLLLDFTPGEEHKSLATAGRLYDELARARIERGAVLIAFGGGVAGDLAGFVAATWLRGIRFVQVPTTLLAAVDASVGGKTAVNLPAGKNLVGAFHQPQAVIIDTDFLATLPDRDFTAGLGESVKQAAISSAEFLSWHEQQADALLARAPETMSELIARNCAAKARVVARDEREQGERVILNHGHTIGHAIEHLLEYELRHGECVALGMLVENELAMRRGLLQPADAERIGGLIKRLGLPTVLQRRLETGDVAAICAVDKKVHGGAARYVLLRGPGEPIQIGDIQPTELQSALKTIQPA